MLWGAPPSPRPGPRRPGRPHPSQARASQGACSLPRGTPTLRGGAPGPPQVHTGRSNDSGFRDRRAQPQGRPGKHAAVPESARGAMSSLFVRFYLRMGQRAGARTVRRDAGRGGRSSRFAAGRSSIRTPRARREPQAGLRGPSHPGAADSPVSSTSRAGRRAGETLCPDNTGRPGTETGQAARPRGAGPVGGHSLGEATAGRGARPEPWSRARAAGAHPPAAEPSPRAAPTLRGERTCGKVRTDQPAGGSGAGSRPEAEGRWGRRTLRAGRV